MSADGITGKVKAQYERLPYPPCNPEDERKRLVYSPLDRLPVINHYCFNGACAFDGGFRALVAGGGTGDSTIFLAEQLREFGAEVVYLDLSQTSMEICRKRAEIRGLGNIRFVLGSILDMASLKLGQFDYISCTGVLHHLADPDAGLRALLSVLKPQGAMYLMLYGRYGRLATYMVQDLMRLINPESLEHRAKLRNLRTVLKSLPESHWARFRDKVAPTPESTGQAGDAGLYDLYLHEQDRAYTIPEIWEWLVDGYGLHIPRAPGGPTETLFYDPELYIHDEAIVKELAKAPPQTRWAAAELLDGQMATHDFYVCRQPGTPLALTDGGALIAPLDDDIERIRAKATEGKEFDLDFSVKYLRLRSRTTPAFRAILRYIDGTRTLDQVFEAVCSELRSSSVEAMRTRHLPQIERMMDLGFFYLRRPHVPLFAKASALQKRLAAEGA
jgi:SAM-dependent methyltransferase